MKPRIAQIVAAALVLAACTEEPPPRSVQEFVDNSILLEAALVRCARDRVETRYEAECVNAREASKIIEAREDAIRRERFDAMSDKKLRARRETQAAAAEARRRAAEDQRLREEAEYLAQFGELPPDSVSQAEDPEIVNAPGAIVPEAPPQPASTAVTPIESPYDDVPATEPEAPSANTNAPGAVVEEEAEEAASDLQSIRDELKRRSDPP